MTEKEIQLTEKNFKTDISLLLNTGSKTTRYNVQNAPILYNLYSNSDTTLYIYKDNRKKIYKLVGTGYIKPINYKPWEIGQLFDTLWVDIDYEKIHKIFTLCVTKTIKDEPIDYEILKKEKEKWRALTLF